MAPHLPRRCLVSLALGGLLLLLAPVSTRAEEVVSTPEEILAMARAQLGERWYGIYVLGKKVGWQRDAWVAHEDRICNEIEFTLKMAFLGKTSSISVREKACFATKEPFLVQTFDSQRNEDGRIITISGRQSTGGLVYEVDTGSQQRTSEVPADSDRLSHAVPWAPIARMRPHDVVKSFSFDELTARKRWEKITLLSREEKNLMGKKQPIYKVLIEDEMGMKLDALITVQGTILEGSMGPSIRIVLEDKKTAQRTDLALLDLYSTSFIPARGEVDYARVGQVKRLKLRLAGASPLSLAPNARQKILETNEESTSMLLTVSTCSPAGDEPPGSDHSQCNADIPCDLPPFVNLARQEAGGHAAALDKALALTRWVNRNFKYSLGSGGGTGDLILKEKKGDCTEFSKALITLLRASGIPARQLSGVVLASDTPPSFGYHAWVEAWIEGLGWITLDPTWGSYPVDATHIVFDVDEGLQMASHLGGLTIEMIEVEYQEPEGDISCD